MVYEPLQLTQAFRNFADAASPWEQVGSGKETTPQVRAWKCTRLTSQDFKIPPPPPPAEEKK